VGVRALLVVVALTIGVAAGCSDDADDPPAAASTSSSATTSTTVGVDEVPDEITVEYVQRVMDALDASWGDMYRLYVDSGGPTAETAAWLDALYDEPELSRIDVDLGREAADGFDTTRTPPGDPTTEVVELISTSPDCIYFEADRQYDAVLLDDTSGTTLIVLRRAEPNDTNATTWVMSVEGRVDAVPEGSPCDK
jgi:hypothetical protein